MANELQLANKNDTAEFLAVHEQFLQVRINSQLFGIPVVRVRDVLKPQPVTKIPLSKPEIIGFMNLRGRIVTVIDMLTRLAIKPFDELAKKMFVVIEVDGELYCLKVDEVAETKTLPISSFEKCPDNLAAHWKDISKGLFKLDKELMLVLDVNNVIKI